MILSKNNVSNFQKKVWDFYKDNKRELPWRNIADPYNVLVSESMLQQTQITRVLVKYTLFLDEFPTVESLAKSEIPQLLKIWQGLGYNRRALNLRRTAQTINQKFNNQIPLAYEELIKLPGIGDYTAKAVITFSTNTPQVFIETNIRSAIIYEFYRDIISEKVISDKEIFGVLEQVNDLSSPREWNYALMDYGAYIKKTFGNPNKKSKSYAKQSKFKGSNRQLRGRILKELNSKEQLKIDTIYTLTDKNQREIESIINSLIKDGFIVKDGDTITYNST